jgi:ABC-type spermidine/putrescine transport system permease subunit II
MMRQPQSLRNTAENVRRFAPDAVLWLVLAAVLVFLFAPVITTVVFSFNVGVLGKQSATITGWTTSWFSTAWNDPALRHALSVSLRAAVGASLLSTVIGVAAGYASVRHRGRVVRNILIGLVYLLLVLPEVVLGVSIFLMLSRLNIPLSILTLIAGHSPFAIAVVSLIVRSRCLALDPNLEEASADLGAKRWQVWRDAILPQLAPAVLAALILSFTFSFDDLVVSLLLSTPTVTTLPVYIYGSVRAGLTPEVYAAAAMLVGATLVMLGLTAVSYRFLGAKLGQNARQLPVLGGTADDDETDTAAPAGEEMAWSQAG